MSIKPIKIYGRHGPNPPKVSMLCEELSIPYEIVDVDFADVKKPAYTAVNPNGRLPAIYDPNTDLTLWESGAIIEYLVDKYDPQRKVSFEPGSKEAYHAKQWLFFQVSGQGPYYGNMVFFKRYHPEKLPSAVTRFANEVKRVTGVLETHLKAQPKGADGPWLVGGKYSYADLAFLPWQKLMMGFAGEDGVDENEWPTVKEWTERVAKREAVDRIFTPMQEAMKAQAAK